MTGAGLKQKVLIVDDDNAVRSTELAMLKYFGLPAEEAENGHQALRMMDDDPFEIMLLDMKMPGMSGIEVLRSIQKSHPRTLVFMVTGFPSIEDAIECMKLGAMDYLVKPFQMEDMKNIMTRAQKIITERGGGANISRVRREL